jgi:hypothetical protein
MLPTHSWARLRRIALALAVAASFAGLTVAAPAQPAWSRGAIAAKTCSSGYKHAVINGSEKCLRRGQFCAHAYDHKSSRRWPYTHYGYRCIKRDNRGNYHLT